MESLNKEKGVFLSNEIDINLLTPTQWSGIIIAMGKYAKFYHEALTGTDSGDKNVTDAHPIDTSPIINEITSQPTCKVCDGDRQIYTVMGFSRCPACNQIKL